MSQIQKRKDDHVRICLEKDVQSGVSTGLEGYRLEYDALPEIDLADVDLSITFLGRSLRAPLIVGAMTGGSEQAGILNMRIARAAERAEIGMALGSQRAMLENPALRHTYDVRKEAPHLPLLFGNIGAVQLRRGVGHADLQALVEDVQADGLYFHLNPLQEAIQPEGDTQFAGLQACLNQAIRALPFPCLIKEVGAGISTKTAEKLAHLQIAGVEASGVGGTSWARVEGYRALPESSAAGLGERLRAFGIPTAASIQACRAAFPDRLVIGSGGIRTGMDAAVAIALGADAVAIARPVLEAAMRSEDDVVSFLEQMIHELRVVCFCTGARHIRDLRRVRVFLQADR